MLKLKINAQEGNQQIKLSDGTFGQLTGVRIPTGVFGQEVIQWTFLSVDQIHEGFVYAGPFYDGLVIDSLNAKDQYEVKIVNK